MSPTNGHVKASAGSAVSSDRPLSNAVLPGMPAPQFAAEQIKEFVAQLEVPFDQSVIDWRVTNATKDKKRGQVIPYANQRAYTDRLNAIFSPVGWTRKYHVQTSANFQRGKDDRVVAKVFVTCDLTIFGLGSHSATGEEWTDDDNAGTSAEAQAFKRTCSCFGLGRYLYYFGGAWVDLDDRKRPKSVPQLPKWATPQGWSQGLRPSLQTDASSTHIERQAGSDVPPKGGTQTAQSSDLVRQIEAMSQILGRRLYRGLLRTVARIWNPNQIQDATLQQKVLELMQGAERGLRRLQVALDRTGPTALNSVLQSLQLKSLDQVDNLETLKQVVLALEAGANQTKS